MNIQTICEVLGEGGCAIFAFLYSIGVEPFKAIGNFNDLVSGNIIKPDATIVNYSKLAEFYGRNIEVTHALPVDAPKDEIYLGRWVRKDDPNINHFVAMRNGKVIYNSLDYSKCVSTGILKDIRIIKEKI